MMLADDRVELDSETLDGLRDRAAGALIAAAPPRVAVFAHNAAETAIAYLAGLHAGVSSVPLNFHLTAGEVAAILADSDATILFVGPETAAVGLAAAAATGARVIGWRCEGLAGVEPWEHWLAAAPPGAPPLDRPPAPYLHYTSGTTGTPKSAETPPSMLPRTATVGELLAIFRRMTDAAPPGPALVVGPLYHTGPLTAVRMLAGGKPVVVLPRFDAEAVLAAVERWRVSVTVMVPTHFQRLLALPADVHRRYDVSSLKLVSHTGAACPVAVKRAMIDWFGPVLLEAYGGTEAGTTNSITSAEWLEKPGSVGRTVAPFEVVVIGDHGAPLPAGQAGALYFRDTTGRGIIYRGDAAKTRSAHIEPGTFTLGDIGYVDADGYVFITDRQSDMIVSGGVNIYPAEIEAALIGHPGVADVAVIGVPDAAMGEAVKALVVPHTGETLAAEALIAFCRERLAGFKCPRSVELVADIGRNAMGKLNKRALRQPYWPTGRTIGG